MNVISKYCSVRGPVRVRNDKGGLGFHCERNYNATALLNREERICSVDDIALIYDLGMECKRIQAVLKTSLGT